MAETLTIDGKQYLKRNPLGVLGLSIITIGIYFVVWFYKINKEIQRHENDQTMSPMRSLMAMIFGWLIIVPPFLAMYNTSKHVQKMEERLGVQSTIEPILPIVIMLVFSPLTGAYIQDHLNRAWEAETSRVAPAVPPPSPTISPA
jgi:ACR3 family arsenite efflux pump ArsB